MYMTSKKLDVKLFLWGLFLLQLSLISVFLAFGSLLVSNIQQDDTAGTHSQPKPGEPVIQPISWFNVKFISNQSAAPEAVGANQPTTGPRVGHVRHPRFKPLHQISVPKPDNYTKYYRPIYYHDGYRERKKLCFIEGTHFPSERPNNNHQGTTLEREQHAKRTNETELEAGVLDVVAIVATTTTGTRTPEEAGDDEQRDISNEILPDGRCRCLPEWHGPDCGQPEVLWRAFIASRIPPRNQTAAPRKVPKHVFYIIETNFISVEVLEMQMMELLDIVSLFVLCDRQLAAASGAKSESYAIGAHISSTDFLKSNQKKILLLEDPTCSGRNIFRKMKKFINRSDMHAEDILLYSRTDEILNRRAVNYFRWYDNWPQPVRFRLKYNVFGFFWQHPESTTLGSAVCQLSTVDEVYRSDPEELLRIDKPVMLIGDLNHYGGWYCRHCYQPIDVVKYLEFIALVNTTSNDSASTTNQSSYLPDLKKGTVLNAEYVQNLVASGKYFDGKLNLIKLQRHVDKYYAPEYVRKNSWRFDNIVINLFARWEDSVIDDEYFS
ncbi:beta-1,4-mannosyl-glycoprotein 4-beta-N-acetylglucosaminyltransferase [Toxorhynchites rutilus septentrionalis]|uniref:beta-1,4-mannosyl-glycoprotein 4-beta-N-acetylglucosaminyltransferase n=1 Tax=Toxorhynchites rutilus septentrionalis TaxID=329112 RepID=UPI00247A60D3|nr:beta-1,4-mannosyl-glycoprotein 4-beta-N-acetylglucosaminyltransferase [Toxorhynchites rutilus septentrionalis]